MFKGYYQIAMDDGSKELTAFSSGSSLYQFRKMPFGLANGVATYQRLMSLVLAGTSWDICVAYIDDLIILGRTFEEHLENLEKVLSRLQGHLLKIKLAKCTLFRSSVKYLGHIVSKEGVLPCTDNVKAILDFPQPHTVCQVKRFIGMVNFFRRFIPNTSEVLQPLQKVANGAKLDWTEKCNEAIVTLTQKLAEPPILAYPNFSETASEFILTTDASNLAAGATLTQKQHGAEAVLAYASMTFLMAEHQYNATESKLAAIRLAVRRFKPLLYDRRYILRTDHKPLTYLATMKQVDAKLLCTLGDLQVAPCTIEYVTSRQMLCSGRYFILYDRFFRLYG